MAKPTYYPDWATQTVTLPGTGNTNKIRPKETIRTVGMDFGQIMTCEELNWLLNNIGLWIHYIVDDFMPTLPNTYLPLVGTKITMAGDATGSVTWNGNKEVTLSIQVVDNSHNHLSANISDATTGAATPSVLVKRDGNGSIWAGDTYICGTSTTDAATIFFQNFAGQTNGNFSSTYAGGGYLSMARINPANGSQPAVVTMWDGGYVTLTSPRTNDPQDTVNQNALVRLDYLNSRLNTLQTTLQNNINTVNTNLTNYINSQISAVSNRITNVQDYLQSQITNNLNYLNGNFVRDIRLGSAYGKTIRKNVNVSADPGGVTTGYMTEGNEPGGDTMYYRPVQKNVNGTWYTIGEL